MPPVEMHTIELTGCTPEPLMNYLKALGVFRLVAEQVDPNVTLAWKNGVAVLNSQLDRNGLIDFFENQYQPTPIVAPWNGGSGFFGGGEQPLLAVENAIGDRFDLYRQVIRQLRAIVPPEKPDATEKVRLLTQCRNELPDECGLWLDTCYVLDEEGPRYFPLLGTGGNDGRLEFANNFLQRLAEVLPLNGQALPSESEGWLRLALFWETLTPLGKSAVGQFNPGGIGGPNAMQGRFEGDSKVNPWDYVLMIEGALLFAGSVARRLGTTGSGVSVFPFSVDSVAVGYGSASRSEETNDGTRNELWMPLWNEFAGFGEVRKLFAEGRAQLGRRQARNAVEFITAVNLLGVTRGISSFSRYGFLKRNGLAFLATPLGRIEVTPRPLARLLDDPPLTAWLEQLRRACRDKEKTPARYLAAQREIDRSMFEFANRSEHGNDAHYLQNILRTLGQSERTLAGGLAFCTDKYIRPLNGLSSEWLLQADVGSAEFRLATALASINGDRDSSVGPIRCYLEEVEMKGNFPGWSAGSTSAVWSRQSLEKNLAAVFLRRLLEAFRAGQNRVPIEGRRYARLADVQAFLDGETDDEKIDDLLWGLLGLDWSNVSHSEPSERSSDLVMPFEFGVPRLLVEPLPIKKLGDRWAINDDQRWPAESDSSNEAKPDPDIFHALSCGRPDAVQLCVTRAARRLKSSGLLVNGYRNRTMAGKELEIVSRYQPTRLLAALLFPLSPHDLTTIANSVLYPPESEG